MARATIVDDQISIPDDITSVTELHCKVALTRCATPEPLPVVWTLSNLERIHFDTYGLRRIPADITKLAHLRELVIESSYLESLPPELAQLERLEALEVRSERFAKLPPMAEMASLRSLKLRTRAIETLPDLSMLPNLETLWIDLNGPLPAWVAKMPRLRNLRVYDARDRLPAWLWSHTQLEELGINYLDAKTAPDFSRLPQLQGVWLDTCHLAGLPPSVVGLAQLRRLTLQNERIARLPEELFRKGAPMELLRLSRAHLGEVPSAIDRFTELRELSLPDNALKAVPDSMATLVKLEKLDLSENAITELPSELDRLVELRVLDVHKNKISRLHDNVGALQKLETLDVSANRIAELPESLFTLPSLRDLSLAQNLLPAVPPQLARLRSLESLLLQNNPATKGNKNKAADALLDGIRAARKTGAATSDSVIAIRARLENGDIAGARALATAPDAIREVTSLLDDAEAKVATRALGLLGELLPDPFSGSLEGVEVALAGNTKVVKAATLKARAAKVGAKVVKASAAIGKARRILVVGERPGLTSIAQAGQVLAALPQLQRWLITSETPHLMAPSAGPASADGLGDLLRSPAIENVTLGLKLAEDGGVPAVSLPTLLALARAHSETKVRKEAGRLFERYAPAELKLAVAGAMGRTPLTSGLDERPVKAYRALAVAGLADFDVNAFALEVVRQSGLGQKYLLEQPSPWGLAALRALLRNGTITLTESWVRLDTLPTDIGELGDELRSFSTGNAQVLALPASFANLRALEDLRFGQVDWSSLPAVLTTLPKLRRLVIGRGLEDFAGLERLQSLEDLTIYSPKAAMPESLGQLQRLRRLSWTYGPSSSLAPLASLKSLTHLDLRPYAADELPPEIEAIAGNLAWLGLRLPKTACAEVERRFPSLAIAD